MTSPCGLPLAELERITDDVLYADTLAGRDPGIDPANFDAGLAVRPRTVEEICDIVRWCADYGYGIVPHGGRTGLAGGAASVENQLVVMMDRLNRIVEIDPAGGVAVVEAGVTLEALDAAAGEHGLCAGIDLAARGSCTIGGMVSTNAGGLEAFRNGVMRNRVLGLEAVTADGGIVSDMKRVTKANEGYDVKQLFIGAEGTLGIVTRVVLRLEPARGETATALVSIASAANGVALFRRLERHFKTRLRAVEVMWGDYFDTTVRELGLNAIANAVSSPLCLIVEAEIDGPDEFMEQLTEAAEAGEIEDALIAKNEQERRDIWQIREDSWAIDRVFPNGYWFDISIPLAALDDYMATAIPRVAAIDPELRLFVCGHLGDGNLHITVSKGTPAPGLYEQLAEALCGNLAAIGGSFSAEHGIGTEKKAGLLHFGDPGKIAMMRSIKQALDPNTIMNPGKVIDP